MPIENLHAGPHHGALLLGDVRVEDQAGYVGYLHRKILAASGRANAASVELDFVRHKTRGRRSHGVLVDERELRDLSSRQPSPSIRRARLQSNATASIRTNATTQGVPERLAQAWFVPRCTSTSPATSFVSPTSI